MVQKKSVDWNPWLHFKQTHLFVKFCVSILLVGLAFRLLYCNYSSGVLTVTESPLVEKPVTVSEETQVPDQKLPQKEKCDLFVGDWIPDPTGPIYTNETCHFIGGDQDCTKNGRPDSGYLYWRWKPRGCELPRFNAERFLDLMRNRSWAFIGDSISRNHVQSLLCILSKVEDADEVYHDEEYKSKRWHFPSHNFTLSLIWSPLLLKAFIFEDRNGVSASDIQLHLDELDKKWTDQFHSFNYVVISGGKWFLKNSVYYENNTVLGCHNCREKNLTEYGFDNAYRKALSLVFNFVVNSNHSSTVLFRTSSPDHFEKAEWFNGGTCERTVPFKEEEVSLKNIDSMMRDIEFEEFNKTVTAGSKTKVNLKVLDTTRLASLRPDGHPSPYGNFHPFAKDKNAKVQNDCLHWCLPGPIDSWSDLVMKMVVDS